MRVKNNYKWMLSGFFVFMSLMNSSGIAFSEESETPPASITPLPGIPKDFEVVYGTGATHAEWGRTEYRILADGSAKTEYTRMGQDKIIRKPQKGQLNAEQLSNLWKKIQDVRFFSLKESYQNSRIMDGSSSFISVRADGRHHMVSVINTKVKAFDQIADYIEQTVEAALKKQNEES